jgi:hypothetical protein
LPHQHIYPRTVMLNAVKHPRLLLMTLVQFKLLHLRPTTQNPVNERISLNSPIDTRIP